MKSIRCRIALFAAVAACLIAPGASSAAPQTFGAGDCLATVDQAEVVFDLTPLGVLTTQRIVIAAAAGSSVQFIQLAMSSDTPEVFSVDGRLGPQPMLVQISFTPTKAGEYAGSLELRALDGDQQVCASFAVSLLGTAADVFELSRTEVAFGFQKAGTTSEPESIRLTTHGAENFVLTSSSPAFAVTPERYEGPKNTDIQITFSPDAPGNFTGTIHVSATNQELQLPVQEIFVKGAGTAPPTITTTPEQLPVGRVGTVYRAMLEAEHGWSTLRWTLLDDSVLPQGLQLASGGILTGTPLEPGTFSFQVEVRDNLGETDEAELALTVEDVVAIGGLVDSASYSADKPIAPGSAASLFGVFESELLLAESAPLPRKLGELEVIFLADDGVETASIPAPLFFVSPSQVNLQVPWETSGAESVAVAVAIRGYRSRPFELETAPVAPSVFTLSGDGTGPAAAVNMDGSVAQPAACCGEVPASPATVGKPLVLYATGLGPLTPAALTGEADGVLRRAVSPARLWLGEVEVRPAFAGEAPGLVGINQVNVAKIPDGVELGDAVPIWIEVDGIRSQDGVTIAISAPSAE